jgi:hypothetical protein
MPNKDNILRPITLISYGRSGTSLVHHAFNLHPKCEVAGETANLIFGTWRAAELVRGIVRPLRIGGKIIEHEERCAIAARAVLLSQFQSSKRYWMQKPIGTPECMWLLRKKGMDEEEFGAWYWTAITRTFPEAKFFTMLRHPYDVVLSAEKYWGWDARGVWSGLGQMAAIIQHPTNRIGYAISYDALLERPEEELRKLCEFVGLEFDAKMLGAMKSLHVPASGVRIGGRELLAARAKEGFSRKSEWIRIDREQIPSRSLDQIRSVWERFQVTLDL